MLKLPTYAAAGVAHVWIADIDAGTIEVYSPAQGRPLLVASARRGELASLPPFDLAIDLSALLAPPSA